jgi:aminopeptidase N
VGKKTADLLLVNDQDLTFAKIRLDESSWQTATQHLGSVADSLTRALIWSAAWDMTRDGEVPTGEFLELVLAGIPAETDIGVVQGVLRQLRAAIDQFATDAHREEYLLRLANAMHTLARYAEPGSDHQLAFARAFAAAAVTNAQLETVRSLLEGSEVWDGLVIDVDLRWHLLTCLVSSGSMGLADIDAELTRDDTATGRRHAAAARAAIPSAEAKAAAWDSITTDTELPNAIVDAMIAGFVQRDQVALITPYRERYFRILEDVWANRTMEIAQSITMGLYPVFLIDNTTVALTDEYAKGEINSALRRLLSEGSDGVKRAMRARQADAAYQLT